MPSGDSYKNFMIWATHSKHHGKPNNSIVELECNSRMPNKLAVILINWFRKSRTNLIDRKLEAKCQHFRNKNEFNKNNMATSQDEQSWL